MFVFVIVASVSTSLSIDPSVTKILARPAHPEHLAIEKMPATKAIQRADPPILEFDPSGKLLTSFGNGMFVHGLDPIPTNFTDKGTIPMLRETFLFWRISKGGPGLPEEGGPWDTAMPAWEKFLKEDEIWEAILFLYDHTGYKPRAKEEAASK